MGDSNQKTALARINPPPLAPVSNDDLLEWSNFKTVQYWTEVDHATAYACIDTDKETTMIKSNSQLRLIVKSPIPSTRLTDTSGNPSESYHWRHMAAVRREWQHEFSLPYVNDVDFPLSEIMRIETRVRRELYP